MLMRRLGWTERLFWLLDQNHPRHFVMAAHVEGRTTPGQWRQALDAVQARHPLLAAGVSLGADSAPYFHRAAHAGIPLRLLQCADAARDWEAEFARELGSPFAPQQAPLMRAALLLEPERAVCILATHHAIADGMSVAFVVRDLLQALEGRALQPLDVPPSLDELVGRAATGLEPRATAAALDASEPGPAAPYRARDGAAPQIRTLRLAPAFLRRIRARAREERATVHGTLCSAMALSFAELDGRPASEPVRIWSPMDVRGLLGAGEGCAVLASSMVVPVECRGQAGIWAAARGLAARLAEARSLRYLSAGSQLLSQSLGRADVATAAQLMARRFSFDFVLTNLGVLPYQPRFGQLALAALCGPAVLSGFEKEHVFGVATTGDVLSLSYSSYRPIESLLEVFERNLAGACVADA